MIFNIKCDHTSAATKNCKFCPDCGKKILHKWITIKCRVCGHYRKPFFNFLGKLKPEKKYCFHCGSNKWNFQYYYESTIPDRIKLISIKQLQTEEEFKDRFKNLNSKTNVWISRP